MPTQTITTHSHLPETLPPFDLTIALLRVNNNRKLLRKLLLMFRDDYRDAMAKLTQLLSTEDYAEAKIMVHTLKGVAGNLQAVELAAAAAELENAIVEKRADLSTWVAKLEIALTAAWQATHSLE